MEFSEGLIVAFTGVVAVSTVAYALLTWRLVSETSQLRKAQTEPHVSVRVEIAELVGHGGLELVIRNEGQGPAQRIKFEFEGDPTYFVGHGHILPIDKLPVIENGLPYLGPGQSFRFLLGWLFGEVFGQANQKPWTFHVDYEGAGGKRTRSTYVVDFGQFAQLPIGNGSPLAQMEKHVSKIKDELHLVVTGFNKLHVLTQTKDEASRELRGVMEGRRSTTSNEENETTSSDRDAC